MASRTPHSSPDEERAFAHRLQVWRLDCGNPSYQELERLMKRQYSAATIHNRLRTGHNLDRRFVRMLGEAFHQHAELPGEPDLDSLYRHLDIVLGTKIPPQWIGPQVSLAAAFQTRRVDSRLRDGLRHGGTVVIRGNGGVGKTQIAAEIAQSSWTAQRADLVVWVSATSRDAVIRRYAEAAVVLGLDGADRSAEAAAERFLAWLAEPHSRQWLVVLDDLGDPAGLRDLWPPAGNGNTVVTTRRRDAALAGPGRTMVDLDVFDPAESAAYLAERLGRPDDDADKLCRELGHLPLALAQAAASILDRRLDCARYLERFRTRRLADVEAGPDGYAAAQSTTWRLAIDTADGHDPVGTAGPLLGLAAWLDPDGIPAGLFRSASALTMVSARRGRVTTADDAADGLTNLERLSLCRLDDDGRTVRVHQLLQRAVREAGAEPDEDARSAADALLAVWPAAETDGAFINVLHNNTEVLLRRAEAALIRTGVHPLLFHAGNSLTRRGLEHSAVPYWSRLLPVTEARLGPEHPNTLTVRNNLAWAYGRTGQIERALNALRELLPVRVRVLGPDHVNSLAARHGVAVWQAEAGDTDEATASLRALILDYEKTLGRDHRDTLNTRLSLIDIRAEVEPPESIRPGLVALVGDYRRVLGAGHHETLEAESLLASVEAAVGEVTSAIERTTRLVPAFEQALGGGHIDTLLARFRAAAFRADGGDDGRALQDMRTLLEDVQRLLDDGHTEVAGIRRMIDLWTP